MAELQIIAITRFAYPGLGGFQTRHDTVAERAAHLWAPARMEARLRSLEHVCLATLAAQTDGGFRHLLITGDALPEPWRGRLEALAARLPQTELIFHPPQNHRQAMEAIVTARIDPDGPPVMQFRQDDDDGVARSFVARARETFRQVRPLWERHERLAIDFNRGYMLALGPEGVRVEETARNHLGVAQALVLPPGLRRTAIHFPHHKLGLLMPSVTLPDACMWLRGVDGMNDSPMPGAADRLAPPSPEQRADLETRFRLDLDAIARSF